MSISQNFPATKPSLNLDFARSKRLDPRITFSRSSTATYIDEDGLIKTVDANIPRFDHNPITGESLGLLIEDVRTNLVTDSGTDYGYGISVGTIPTNDVAPDGSTVACKYNLTGTVQPFLNVNVDISLSPGSYTMSMWLKGTTNFSASFAFVGETNIEIYANTANVTTQWQRFTLSFTLLNSQTNSRLQVFFGTEGENKIFSVWGAQLEAGTVATSYIKRSSGVTATRSADSASITGTNFSGFYNNNEGSVVSTFKFYANHLPYYEAVSVAGGGAGFMVINDGIGLVTDCYGGGTVVTGGDNARTKFITGVRAYKFSTNDSVIGCSGASSITTQTGTITNPNSTALWLGRRGDGSSVYVMNGTIKNVFYYPVRLSNSQLRELTK